MENIRNRVDIDFVTTNKSWGKHSTKKMSTIERKLANALYDGHIIYNDSLMAIKKDKAYQMHSKFWLAKIACSSSNSPPNNPKLAV